MIGTSLGHFEITAKLGEGGMGEVYRARDKRLDRGVAIKVLPTAVAANPERMARFEREAKVLASLNHPNIAAIYEIGEAPGADGAAERFLVMELADGENLAERLARGALSPDDAVPVGLQIARGLEAAHDRGIVHRDLKPANVQVSGGGEVKILDFGLAKAFAPEAVSGSDVAIETSPTLTYQPSQAGVLLGTAAYMSPEQARGKAVDRRADIWAFGVVLLEMLSGEKVFSGETTTDILASIVRSEPDLDRLPRVPRALRRLIERCLDKDADRRLRDIGEARIVLEDLEAGRVDPTPATDDGVGAPRRSGIWAALVVVAAIAGGLGFWAGRGDVGEAPDATESDTLDVVRKVTFGPGLEHEPDISPDGNYLVYTANDRGNLDLLVVPLAGGAPTRIVDDPGDDAQASWSPDGTRIAFASARRHGGRLGTHVGLGALTQYVFGSQTDVFVVPALGGQAQMLAENGSHPDWSPDGTWITFASDREIWKIPSNGGDAIRLTDDREHDFQPAWSPDGAWIAFGSSAGLSAVPADGGPVVRLTEGGTDPSTGLLGANLSPAWTEDGQWITYSAFVEGVLNIWRIRFDPSAPSGPIRPERVTTTGVDNIEASHGPGGLMAFTSVQFAPDVWAIDPTSREQRQITSSTSIDDYPHLGPDGKTLVFFSTRGGPTALWSHDLETGRTNQVSPDGLSAANPRWAPTGDAVLYEASGPNDWSSMVLQSLGSMNVTELGEFVFGSWSPDGQAICASQDATAELWIIDRHGEGEPLDYEKPELETDSFCTWSPAGDWIVFSREGERPRQIWKVRTDGSEMQRIPADESLQLSHPQWSPLGGDQLVVVVDHEEVALMSATTGELDYLTDYDDSTLVVDYPGWSVDGSTIHFSLSRRIGDIFVVSRVSAR